MSERQSPIEKALDVFFYAPLGFALNVGDILDDLAEKGREQVAMARVMGEMAVGQGQQEAAKAAGRARRQAEEALGLRDRPAPTPPSSPPPTTAEPPTAEPRRAPQTSAADAPVSEPEPSPNGQTATAQPPVDSLAIPGYDSLAASQVVQRLAGLTSDELDAVRAYEEGGRSRKTILTRVSQLQSAR